MNIEPKRPDVDSGTYAGHIERVSAYDCQLYRISESGRQTSHFISLFSNDFSIFWGISG